MKENVFTRILNYVKRNVIIQVLSELVLLIIILIPYLRLWAHTHVPAALFSRIIDAPTLFFILMITSIGLTVTGVWRDFLHAFSVGKKRYSLLELKNIIGAVSTCQKLVLCSGMINCIITIIHMLYDSTDLSDVGPYVVLSLIALLYVVFIEYLLIPVKLNAERIMYAEMDFNEDE